MHPWQAPRGLGRRRGASPRRLRGLQPRLQRSRRHARLCRDHAVPFMSPLATMLGAPLYAGGTWRGPVSRTHGHSQQRCHAARAPASCPLPVALHPPARQALKGPQGLQPWSYWGGAHNPIGTHLAALLLAAPGAASIARGSAPPAGAFGIAWRPGAQTVGAPPSPHT